MSRKRNPQTASYADVEKRRPFEIVAICTPSLGSIAQNGFQGGVEVAPDLRHALIAILAEERRWLIVFKNPLALLVLEQNDAQR